MLIYQMIEFKLSDLLFFQKTINLVYQIDKFIKTKHQFAKNIIKKTLKYIKFVIEKYIQKSDKFNESINCQQCVKLKSQISDLQFLSD